jgi:outer membrane lipoprotein carrier protein
LNRLALLAALCGPTLFSPVAADELAARGDADGMALVDNFVRNVRTLSGHFEQSLVDADDQVVEISSGTLEIRRPGQFRWAYDEPYEQLLVADGVNVWSYDVDLAQVTVKPQAEVLSNTPALLLGGSSDALDQFDYVDTFSDRGTIWVRLRPKDAENGFNKVELGFNGGDLTRMMFFDNLEQTTLIALFDVSLNQDIDSQHFRFEPPDDVDVVGMPANIDENTADADSES